MIGAHLNLSKCLQCKVGVHLGGKSIWIRQNAVLILDKHRNITMVGYISLLSKLRMQKLQGLNVLLLLLLFA